MGFTRTFMELKLVHGLINPRQHTVLLVPLWNWNVESLIWYTPEASFTRTFMELKLEM